MWCCQNSVVLHTKLAHRWLTDMLPPFLNNPSARGMSSLDRRAAAFHGSRHGNLDHMHGRQGYEYRGERGWGRMDSPLSFLSPTGPIAHLPAPLHAMGSPHRGRSQRATGIPARDSSSGSVDQRGGISSPRHPRRGHEQYHGRLSQATTFMHYSTHHIECSL